MLSDRLRDKISNYKNFPKEGILFRDISPILQDPFLFSELINQMSKQTFLKEADCIIGVDARGFIFASAIAMKLAKPFILARKSGKLPGKTTKAKFSLEYGESELNLQIDSLKSFQTFAIVDDLLATGGTVSAIHQILKCYQKCITGLSIVIELEELKARSLFDFKVSSEIKF